MSAALTRSEKKRQDILAAAKQAFQQEGYDKTSMDRIAKLASVSKRTVYNHFESKEALIMTLMAEMWQQVMHSPAVHFKPDVPVREQLIELLLREIDAMSDEEFLALNRVAFGYFFFEPDAMKRQLERMGVQETAMMSWLKAASDSGQLKPLDANQASTQLHGLIKAEAFWPQMLRIAPVLTEPERVSLAERSADLFLSHYQA